MGATISNPDSVLWRYLGLRQRLGSPPSRQPIIDRGLVFGDRCGAADCRATALDARLEEVDDRSGASRWICNDCGQPWPVDVAFLLRASPTTGPRRTDVYQDLGTLSKILATLLVREQRIYLLLYLYEGIGGYAEVADEANRRWPGFHPPTAQRGPRARVWTRHTVGRIVLDARQRLNGELRARGMKPGINGG